MDTQVYGWMQQPGRGGAWHRVRSVRTEDGPLVESACGLAFLPERRLELRRHKALRVCLMCVHADEAQHGRRYRR